MVAMMLVPSGATAAAVGSSVIWKIVVSPSKIAAWPSTWKVNTGAPITTTRSWSRSASESCAGEAWRKPANCGCCSGKLHRAENGLIQIAARVFSATCTMSTMNTDSPSVRLAAWSFGVVRASRIIRSEYSARLVQIFWPLTT